MEAGRDLARAPRDGAKKAKLEALNDKVGKNFDFLSDALAAAAAAAIMEMDDPLLQDPSLSSPHVDPELQHLVAKAKDDARNAEAVAFKPAPSAQDAAKWAKEGRRHPCATCAACACGCRKLAFPACRCACEEDYCCVT